MGHYVLTLVRAVFRNALKLLKEGEKKITKDRGTEGKCQQNVFETLSLMVPAKTRQPALLTNIGAINR